MKLLSSPQPNKAIALSFSDVFILIRRYSTSALYRLCLIASVYVKCAVIVTVKVKGVMYV